MAIDKCPGQDQRFWKPEDIFEVTCPGCGAAVELWKDDPRRKCPQCGAEVKNPKLALGCAEWCPFAKECLGHDPSESAAEDTCRRLVDAMEKTFGADKRRIDHALAVLKHAEEILAAERGASPLVVKAAAILHDIGILEAERKHGSSSGRFQEMEGPPIARKIMEEIGLDEATVDHVTRIVGAHHGARGIDTKEFRIVWDADRLVNLPEEFPDADDEKLRSVIDKVFKTKTGAEIAERLFLRGQTD